MKKPLHFVALVFLLVFQVIPGQAQPHWNNLKVYRSGALLPHDRIIPDGDWTLSLNGSWQFRYFDNPDQATLSPEKWDSIRVPGNIELQGFGVPVYVNMRNEFPSNPPYAPTEYNPTGVYSRTFTLPLHWAGRRTIVKFGAAGSAMFLYVNGREVGYSEDSKLPHEWDITRFLHEGTNRMAVKLIRWSDGSYLECQDMWRMSGITRDVELYSVPWIYLSDIKVIADLDTGNYSTGLLDVIVDLSERAQGGSIEMEIGGSRYTRKLNPGDWYANFMTRLDSIHPWSDAEPTLYPLTLRFYDQEGHLAETVTKKIGFRHLDIKGGQLRLNGVPVEIRGVNRHEHSCFGGHYITPQEMRQDVSMMKEMGINAVRTSHYPDDELWYDLCDSAGIMLWDEANLETHAQGYGENSLAKKTEWLEPMLDRIYCMYRRDRNHPSVIAWSLGNECGNGICMEEAYRKLKEYDPTRPVVYERAELASNTDIVCVMYPSLQYLSQYARNPHNTRPYIISEYCHAMGNSMGGLQDYWDTIDRYPQLQGGFLWDWIDQSFPLPNGDTLSTASSRYMPTYWAAGGDLGSLPGIADDDAFCANGILAADRTPHPHAAEVEAVYTRHRSNMGAYPPLAQAQPSSAKMRTLADLVSSHSSEVKLTETTRHFALRGGRTVVRIDRHDGSIASLRHRGRELLAIPIKANFWRPPTENDLVDPFGARAWQGLDSLCVEVVDCIAADNQVQQLLRFTTPDSDFLHVKQIVQLADDGQVQLSYLVAPKGQFRTLPKLGIQFGLDTAYSDCRFYGNLYETYPDRRAAQRIGRWQRDMSALAAPQYVVPQEQGNHEARWVRFLSEENKLHPALTFFSPDTLLNFSVRRFADSVLTRARRWRGLVPDTFYTVNIDYRVAPLGTATCGPGVDARYVIGGDSTYAYRFVLIPGLAEGTPTSQFQVPEGLLEMPSQFARTQPLPIGTFACSQQPDARYGKGFPTMLNDGLRGVPGDYSRCWTGFLEPDTVTLDLTLEDPTRLGSVEVGVCHSPSDWVVRPERVQMQWSRDGRQWSPWQDLALPRPPAYDSLGSQRLRYILHPERATHVRLVRLRFLCNPFLPSWHAYAGKPSWLMIDEVELKEE